MNREGTGAEMGRQAAAAQINIRPCHGLAEFEACVELQRRVWRGADIDVVPLPLFVVAAETGGQVLGAFAGDKLVGFTLALAGMREGIPFLHSHMTAVQDAYRDRGIGRGLKLLQRQDALARGIARVEWTFDPLEIKNAYFNLVRLGAIARRFLPNCYGITTSPLHAGLPTDRLVVEWWLTSKRVEDVLSGQQAARQAVASGSAAEPQRVHVPAVIGQVKQKDLPEALRVQREVREQFQYWFARGCAATGFEITEAGGNYLLEPWNAG